MLSYIGSPQQMVSLALLVFNFGLKVGQIMFIAVVLCVMFPLQRLGLAHLNGAWLPDAYAVGIGASYWTVERIAGAI